MQAFLRMEASGGLVLVVCAAAALLLANGPVSAAYDALVHAELRIGVGELSITQDLQHWVNDALMAVSSSSSSGSRSSVSS